MTGHVNRRMLSADEVRAIRADRRIPRDVAISYAVSTSLIVRIRNRELYKDVPAVPRLDRVTLERAAAAVLGAAPAATRSDVAAAILALGGGL